MNSEYLNGILNEPPFGIKQSLKETLLLPELNALTAFHRDKCPLYNTILDGLGYPAGDFVRSVADVPFLPVSMFKTHDLRSVSSEDTSSVMASSGTSGQVTSKIVLDRETAALQGRASAKVITSLIGPKRLPMMIVDQKRTVRDARSLRARGAGILGFMRFGRDHTFLLNEEMKFQPDIMEQFLEKHAGEEFLIFGFTFMIWKYLVESLRCNNTDLSLGVLLHGGGWKKLENEAVDNSIFKTTLSNLAGLTRVRNFYGMVEQMGTIFLEGRDGLFYPPRFADVIIRDPSTWKPAAIGEPGVIQVISLVPRSYPGHSLLTEDVGILHSVNGKAGASQESGFSIIGRIPATELRGCGDIHAASLAESV